MLTAIFTTCPTEILAQLVREESTGDLIDNLDASWTLYDSAGEELGTGAFAADGDPADGNYRATIPRSVAITLTAGCEYRLEITDGLNLGISCAVVAVPYRGRGAA